MLTLGAPSVLIEARIDGETWSHARGVRTLDGRIPAEASDSTHVANITKSMVAVSVLKLMEEGALRLEDPVEKDLPGFDAVMKPPGPVTIEHLLRHETGIPPYEQLLFASRSLSEVLATPMTAAEILDVAAGAPWVLVPGSGMQYSNTNYIVLGRIIERLRGQPIARVLETDIIRPLGLQATQLTSPGAEPQTMVHGYIAVDGVQQDVTHSGATLGNAAIGLVSSVGDLNSFYAALLKGELLRPSTQERLLRAPRGYGLGLERWQDACQGGFYYGHAGEWFGNGTIALSSIDAKRQVSISLAYPPEPANLTPNAPSNPLAWEVLRIARKALDTAC